MNRRGDLCFSEIRDNSRQNDNILNLTVKFDIKNKNENNKSTENSQADLFILNKQRSAADIQKMKNQQRSNFSRKSSLLKKAMDNVTTNKIATSIMNLKINESMNDKFDYFNNKLNQDSIMSVKHKKTMSMAFDSTKDLNNHSQSRGEFDSKTKVKTGGIKKMNSSAIISNNKCLYQQPIEDDNSEPDVEFLNNMHNFSHIVKHEVSQIDSKVLQDEANNIETSEFLSKLKLQLNKDSKPTKERNRSRHKKRRSTFK